MRHALLFLAGLSVAAAARADIAVLDIDRAGADAVSAMKQSPDVRA